MLVLPCALFADSDAAPPKLTSFFADWVIIVSFVLMKKVFKVSSFSAQEHAVVTLCGTAAAFSQSLGLSGGLATLTLYYDVSFGLGELFG